MRQLKVIGGDDGTVFGDSFKDFDLLPIILAHFHIVPFGFFAIFYGKDHCTSGAIDYRIFGNDKTVTLCGTNNSAGIHACK